jgi:hypothetical protein
VNAFGVTSVTAARGIHAWNGCNYARELAESAGIRDWAGWPGSAGALQ